MWANMFSIVFLTCGVWVVVANWACTVASYLQPQRIQRDACVVPFAAQVFAAVAAIFSAYAASPLLSASMFWVVALADVALLQVFRVPACLLKTYLKT